MSGNSFEIFFIMLLNSYAGNVDLDLVNLCEKEINTLLKQNGLSAITRHKPHLLLPSIYSLGTSEIILDAVSNFLNTQYFIGWYSVLFIKKANTTGYVPWHYDDFFWGFEGNPKGCTAWVALGDVDQKNGSMEFVTNREAAFQKHFVSTDSNNLLIRGNDCNFQPEKSDIINFVNLPKGGFSIHSNKAWHRSGPNLSDNDRLAVAFRFIDETAKPVKLKFIKRGIFYTRPDSNLEYFKIEERPKEILCPKCSPDHTRSIRLAAFNTFFGDSHRSLFSQIIDLFRSLRNKYLLNTAKKVIGLRSERDINEG